MGNSTTAKPPPPTNGKIFLITPADAIVTGLLSYDDIFLTEGCWERHIVRIIRDTIRRA